MTKADLKILEKAFEMELQGGLLQRNSKPVQKLAADGFLEHVTFVDRARRFAVTIEGYALTHKGRIAYGETCADREA